MPKTKKTIDVEILALPASSLFAPCFGDDGAQLAAESLSAADAEYLKAAGPDPELGPAGGIRGVVIAEARTFFSYGRGRFSKESLEAMLAMWPEEGLPSAAQHPDMLDDKLFNFLGRMVSPKLSKAVYRRAGKSQTVPALRADLVFDGAAALSPIGDLPQYITERVKSDPGSLGTSLVLRVERITERDAKGRPKRGPDGEELPDLWMPLELLGSDVVAAGDAVTSILGQDDDEDERKIQAYDPRADRVLAWLRWKNKQRMQGIG